MSIKVHCDFCDGVADVDLTPPFHTYPKGWAQLLLEVPVEAPNETTPPPPSPPRCGIDCGPARVIDA